MNVKEIVSHIPDYSCFMTVDELDASTFRLAEQYPDRVQVRCVGHSRQGHPIQLIQIGHGRKNALVFAHSYQSPDILEIADLTGDSFALSAKAKEFGCETIVLCGVRFMAETLKMLCPEKKVILPVADAACAMANQISPARVLEFKREHPDYAVVAYINTSTELKAVCDVCVTSSSALKIVEKLPQKNILFIPDKNLGSFVRAKLPQKNIVKSRHLLSRK